MQEFRYNFEKLHGFKIKSVWTAIEAAGNVKVMLKVMLKVKNVGRKVPSI